MPLVMDTSHGDGTTSTAVAGGKRRFHTTFRDGAECVEEFDIRVGRYSCYFSSQLFVTLFLDGKNRILAKFRVMKSIEDAELVR